MSAYLSTKTSMISLSEVSRLAEPSPWYSVGTLPIRLRLRLPPLNRRFWNLCLRVAFERIVASSEVTRCELDERWLFFRASLLGKRASRPEPAAAWGIRRRG